ncbi:MAG: NAD-dependent epimerase/dehydratase family protein [bacterium]
MAEKCLVTGACGFVGSNLVKTALLKGFKVRATDLPSAGRERLEGADAEFVPSDVTKRESLDGIAADADYVFHPAAVFSYSAPRRLFHEVNVKGTENLCRALAAAGRVKKFVLFSSAEVYGITPPALLPTREDAPKKPLSPYAKSKLGQEKVVMRFSETRGLPAVILRPGPVYGPGNRYGVAKMILEPARLPFIAVPSNMNTHAPFVSVMDVCEAALFLARRDGASGEAYNVVDDSSCTVYAFFKLLARLLKKPFFTLPPVPPAHMKFWGRAAAGLCRIAAALTRTEPLFEEDYMVYVGNDFRFSNAKLKSAGYRLIRPDVRDGLRETIEWYRSEGLIR